MKETILFSQQGPVARITLNKPEKHNSLGHAELSAIQRILREIAINPDLRVLLVSGSGQKTFCAGAALDELGAGHISGDHFQETTNQLAALRIPTICAVNGNVFGGGVELALSCDFRVGREGIRMRVPAAAIGLCYPLQGIQRFVERLGVNVAKRVLMAAEQFDAESMRDIGFLDHLVAPAQLNQFAHAMALDIAELAPLAVGAMKEVLNQAASGAINIEASRELAQRCIESADLQEGFAAQREKRRPDFKGS